MQSYHLSIVGRSARKLGDIGPTKYGIAQDIFDHQSMLRKQSGLSNDRVLNLTPSLTNAVEIKMLRTKAARHDGFNDSTNAVFKNEKSIVSWGKRRFLHNSFYHLASSKHQISAYTASAVLPGTTVFHHSTTVQYLKNCCCCSP